MSLLDLTGLSTFLISGNAMLLPNMLLNSSVGSVYVMAVKGVYYIL